MGGSGALRPGTPSEGSSEVPTQVATSLFFEGMKCPAGAGTRSLSAFSRYFQGSGAVPGGAGGGSFDSGVGVLDPAPRSANTYAARDHLGQ